METDSIDPYSILPACKIDPAGTFKYIQIRFYRSATAAPVFFIRGYKRLAYHMDIFENFNQNELPTLTKTLGVTDTRTDCPGGGRIEHKLDSKELSVYGYSQSYGQPDHSVAVALLQKQYTDYNITWSNEGY